LLGKINVAFAKFNRPNVEATFQPTEEMKESMERISQMNETDGFASLNATELSDVHNVLKAIAKEVRINK
jgi:predicted DNA-binding ArsR family transcriptional regulator